jgi:hypothetical protein
MMAFTVLKEIHVYPSPNRLAGNRKNGDGKPDSRFSSAARATRMGGTGIPARGIILALAWPVKGA